jgi:hypothetical protein
MREAPKVPSFQRQRCRLGIARKTLRPQLVNRSERRYDAILAAGLAFHEAQRRLPAPPRKHLAPGAGRTSRRTGHNLLLRFFARKRASLVPGPTYRLLAATPSNQTPPGIRFFDLGLVSMIEPAVRLAD